jgi:hypothetical protein
MDSGVGEGAAEAAAGQAGDDDVLEHALSEAGEVVEVFVDPLSRGTLRDVLDGEGDRPGWREAAV